MTIHLHHDDIEPHASSPTAEVLDNLELYGYRPRNDEPDPRPLPEPATIEAGIADAFHALASIFNGTCLDGDLSDLLWSLVNDLHRMAERAQRDLDRNEDAQKRGQREQDGSEIRSVELEQLLTEGQALLDRRATFETMREHGADLFEIHTASTWRPRGGSRVSHANLTAAQPSVAARPR